MSAGYQSQKRAVLLFREVGLVLVTGVAGVYEVVRVVGAAA